MGAVVQRWRGKCPDSAGGGIGRRVTGLYDITSCPSAFPVTCPPPFRFTERLRKGAAGAFRRSSSCLGNTAETRRETGAPVRTDSCSSTEVERYRSDLHFHSEKGLGSFPPSLHPLWESQAGCSYLSYQVSSGGEKGAKVNKQNRFANSNTADFPYLGEAIHIA